MPSQLHFTFPAQVVPNGDGSYTVRPGPVTAEEWIPLKQFAKQIDRPRNSIYLYLAQLKDENLARKNGPRLWELKHPEAVQWWQRRWNP